MDATIRDFTSGNPLGVDASGNASVKLSLTPANMGGLRVFAENDPGSVTGSPLLRSAEVSSDFRQRVGVDTVLDSPVFNVTTNLYGKFHQVGSGLAMSVTPTGLALNIAAGTSTGFAGIRSFASYPVLGGSTLYAEYWWAPTTTNAANAFVEFGAMGTLALSNAVISDGIFFRISGAGVNAVVAMAGTEVEVALPSATLPLNEIKHYIIAIHQDEVEFWIDGVLHTTITRPANQPFISTYANMHAFCFQRHPAISATAFQSRLTRYCISLGDTILRENSRIAFSNESAISVPAGVALGSTANITNSAAASNAPLSNTTASYTTKGGNFQFAAVAGAETDYALFAYLVPSAASGNKNLVVRGIKIDTFNMGAAVATTPTLLHWYVGVGSTANSLATVDGGTVIATRAPRRESLGVQSLPIGLAVGASVDPVVVNLPSPLIVEPGTMLHIILRMPVATATASQIIRGSVFVNSEFI